MHSFNSSRSLCGVAAYCVMVLALFWSGHAAADYKLGALDITQTWARATPKGASSGAAYLTVTNTGSAAERLSCVSSEVAAQCQIHEMSMDNGIMKMRPVEGGLEIKPGQTVTLAPGGYHLMLLDLKQPLAQGSTITATLKDDTGAILSVEFPVAAIGAPAPGTSTTSDGMHMQGPPMMQMNKQ